VNDSHSKTVGPLQYRRDIQVIRGIAVVLVVLYHLEVPGFRNGFLGVDIFFVVSGYLMQKLYDPKSGAIAFWKRRAARLVPAYFVVVLLTLAVGALMLKPDGMDRLAQQVILAAGFLSNIGFWQEESYFSSIHFSPLLHLWSLGVEFQFYFLVPVVAAIFARSQLVFALLVAGSFAACLVILAISPKTAFFMMPFRFWEFGMGMLVANWRSSSPLLPRWVFPVAVGGFFPLMFMPIEGSSQSILFGHPSIAALTACLLTSVMLSSELGDALTQSRTGRVFQTVGDFSYSLYLVHFPIIAIYSYVPFDGNNVPIDAWERIILLLLSIGAGYLLFIKVERPATSLVSWRRLAILGTATVAVGMVAAQLQLLTLDAYDRNVFYAGRDRGDYRCGKWMRIVRPTESFCTFGSDSDGKLVLLIGDSHSDAIKESFIASAGRKGLSVGMPVDNDSLTKFKTGWVVEQAKRLGAERVFIHHSRRGPSVERAAKIIDELIGAGIPVGYILPIPVSDVSVPKLVIEAREQGLPPPTLDGSSHRASLAPYSEMLASRPSVAVIDPATAVCADTCPVVDGYGHPYYFDNAHLTLTGARRLEPLFDAALSTHQ
jgi:peptidoglycan/LPS O-acetylase OafA/YrhL